tara:strand:- start:2575 stop:3303 length:729 start_codon:yes stop_codon:yes gene_type:complete
MKLILKVATGLAAILLAGAAQANLMVQSIDLAMVNTEYNSRSLSASMSAEDAFMAALFNGFMSAYSNPGNIICDLSVDVFDNVSSHDTCGGSKRDIGALFAISGSAEADTQLQLGLDWGRGGFIALSTGGLAPEITRYNSDIWWSNNWNNGDVLDFIIPKTQEFLLIGLGFEGCCDGSNSARWRSLAEPAAPAAPATFAVGMEAPEEWNLLQVNAPAAVPVPGGAYLLGIGLLGLVYSRRAR